MAIYQTAHYRVNEASVARVRAAIEVFVRYVESNEPGTRMYRAWQQEGDPTRFVHLFIFEDDAAHRLHGQSDAVRQFESVYRPELVEGPVVFIDHTQVATNQPD